MCAAFADITEMCGDLSDKPGAPSKTFGLPKFRSGVWMFGEGLALSFLVNAVLHAFLPAVTDVVSLVDTAIARRFTRKMIQTSGLGH